MIYHIGDKVQAGDGRIGTVIEIDRASSSENLFNLQAIVVRFFDHSLLKGRAENFKVISSQLFSKIDFQIQD